MIETIAVLEKNMLNFCAYLKRKVAAPLEEAQLYLF